MTLEAVHERVALRRVHGGRVVYQGWCYLDGGAPVPAYLSTILDELIEHGLVGLSDPDPQMGNACRLRLTPDGVERFHAVCGADASPPAPTPVSTPVSTPEGNADPAGCQVEGTPGAQPGAEPRQFPEVF